MSETRSLRSKLARHLIRGLSSAAVITIIAFAVRIEFLRYEQRYAPVPINSSLPFGYETGRIAQSIALGRGFSSPLSVDSGPTAWLTPVYPYLLAGVFKLFGVFTYRSWVTIIAINCAFSALTCLPIYYAGKRLGGLKVGAAAAWIWAFFADAILMPTTWVWDSSLAALIAACILMMTIKVWNSDRSRDWIVYGALWGLAAMVNPSILAVLPFLLGWFAWEKHKASAVWVRQVATIAILVFAACVPWTIRNYRVFHQFVPLRSNFGLELWLGNNPDVPDTWAGELHPNDYPPEREKFQRLGEIAYMKQKQSEAIAFMKSHPVDTARFMWRRFVDTWTGNWDPIQDIWAHASWYERTLLLSNIGVSVLGLVGLLVLSRLKNPFAVPLALFPLIFPIIYYVTHPSRRYRHPIDPVMITVAAFAITYPFRLFAERRQHALADDSSQLVASPN
ncbi:MAG TPA: glycosyltransferase family 39 protein [Candidatus Acidoferrales bacterium]|nr:glycosyltransferase family 39 protein [Candidatus Acidoferrales bacterium]